MLGPKTATSILNIDAAIINGINGTTHPDKVSRILLPTFFNVSFSFVFSLGSSMESLNVNPPCVHTSLYTCYTV